MAMRWVVGILMTIFLLPVCIFAGAFGGCIVGAMTTGVDQSGVGFTVSMLGGIGIGLAAGVALTVLAVRSVKEPPSYPGGYPPYPPYPPQPPYQP
jgi:hypothetical protein